MTWGEPKRRVHSGETAKYKRAMNPKTPRALAQFAAILVVVGIVIMDPLAGLSILVLAGILAAIAFAFGSQRVRIFAILWPKSHLRRLLLIITAFSIWKYPDARSHLERYRDRTLANRHSIMPVRT
jgi:hypothetical protein